MSKIVFVCLKNRNDKFISSADFETLSQNLLPDNISAKAPQVIEQDGILIGVLNPNPSLPIKNSSVCAGQFYETSSNWWEPLSPLPDGTYALFRADEKVVELVTDILASRPIWYVQTERMFVASTSQRAIVFFLQSFQPNQKAFLWMLSSGSLGLGNSWDKRINFLDANSRLVLNRDSWEISIKKEDEINFFSTGKTEQEYEKNLREALEYSFAGLSLDFSKWALPISGGVDSREILLRLKDHQELKCITIGMYSELGDKRSDVNIGKRLAEYFGLDHLFFPLDAPNEPVEQILNRFISTGEARTDNIYHDFDGLKTWKTLYENNIYGIIRGDEVFGWPPQFTKARHRQSVGGFLLYDFHNTQFVNNLAEKQFGEQVWPDILKRKSGESIYTWGDRLYQSFRIPVHTSAWNEIKYSYIELTQPFLSRRIVNTVRELPDSIRIMKKMFKKIVTADSPQIPYSTHVMPQVGFLRSPEAVTLISDSLNSSHSRVLLSNELVDYILKYYTMEPEINKSKLSLRGAARTLLPERIKDMLRERVKTILDDSVLAFRAYIACKANELYARDADNFSRRKSNIGII